MYYVHIIDYQTQKLKCYYESNATSNDPYNVAEAIEFIATYQTQIQKESMEAALEYITNLPSHVVFLKLEDRLRNPEIIADYLTKMVNQLRALPFSQ